MRRSVLPEELQAMVSRGVVIPALPLALDAHRRFDVRSQRALLRYYLDAGVGGIAVGVHTTQFAIRDPEVALFEPVLRVAADVIDRYAARPVLKIAGVCGRTEQALREASFAQTAGYHAGLVSLAALADDEIPALVAHCRAIASVMPIIGFYLQPAVGGRVLPYAFWRAFVEIPNVLAIKIAPFNRYQTLDVVRAVCDAGREKEITLYTGNDENIVIDLLTPFRFGAREVRIVGGLLGHWAVWTRRAVEMLEEIHHLTATGEPVSPAWLARALQITDCNAAFFDAAHHFAGCIPGIHEVLRRQGLLQGTWCLNLREQLSPGQAAEIDRVYQAYPHLHDDAFVRENKERWFADD